MKKQKPMDSVASGSPQTLDRRQALGMLALPLLGGTLVAPGSARAAVPGDSITVLYSRGPGADASLRSDPAVQAATLALEDEFVKRGFRVLQPSAQVYQLLDSAPEVVLSFDPDAGFSLIFSLYKDVRPKPASDLGIAEVRLEGRVLVGPSIVDPQTGRGQMMTELSADTRAFGERRALELAARKAAADMAEKMARRLRSYTPEQLQALAQPVPMVMPNGQVVASTAPAAAPVSPPAVQVPPTGPLPPPARRFALVVGVSDYSAVRRNSSKFAPGDLPGVAIDVRNLTDSLRSFGFPASQVKVLDNAAATSANLRNELMRLAGTVTSEDLVLIAISAHGAPKQYGLSGYGQPVLNDFTVANDPNALDFWQLQGLAGNLPAGRVVLLIDTCHSGGATQSMPSVVVGREGVSVSTGTVAPDPARIAAALNNGRHFAILAASRAEEVSLEDPPNGGLFTSRLLYQLRATKAADPLQTVFDEVKPLVMKDSARLCQRAGCKVQTPVLAFSGRGNMIRL